MELEERLVEIVKMVENTDLDDTAKVIINELIRLATELKAELDDLRPQCTYYKALVDYIEGIMMMWEGTDVDDELKERCFYADLKNLFFETETEGGDI